MVLETIVAAVGTYIVLRISDGFLQKIGEEGFERVNELYQKVVQKFTGNAYAEQTLKRLEEQPFNKQRKLAFESLLIENLAEDVSFADDISKIIEKLKETTGDQFLVLGNRNITVGGNVTDSQFSTGNNSSSGDLKK
jgi:hypothetical protein